MILDAEGGKPRMLGNVLDYSEQEIAWIATHERVTHLTDVVVRRTQIAVCGALTTAGLNDIAAIVGSALGWDEMRRDDEIERTLNVLRTHYAQVLL